MKSKTRSTAVDVVIIIAGVCCIMSAFCAYVLLLYVAMNNH